MRDLFTVARILRPHGRRGEVALHPLTDHRETLLGANAVYLGREALRPRPVEGVRLHRGIPLMKLQGIDSISDAEELKGVEICLPREELVPLEEGEYFLHDLMGLMVIDSRGRRIGRIRWLMETGAAPVLVGTKDADGGEFMIPFAPGTVEDVDTEAKILTLKDLPGLVDGEEPG